MNSIINQLRTIGGLSLEQARKIQIALFQLALSIICLVFISILATGIFGLSALVSALAIIILLFLGVWGGIITPETLLALFGISAISAIGDPATWVSRFESILKIIYDAILNYLVYVGIIPLMILLVANPAGNIPGALAAYIISGGIGLLALKKGSSSTIPINLAMAIGIAYALAYIILSNLSINLPIGWILFPLAVITFFLLEGISLSLKKILLILLMGMVWYALLWTTRPDITDAIINKVTTGHVDSGNKSIPDLSTALKNFSGEEKSVPNQTTQEKSEEIRKKNSISAGTIVSTEIKSVDLTGCNKLVNTFALKPTYGYPVRKVFNETGEYAIVTTGYTDQLVGGWRSYESDGRLMDLSGHQVWKISNMSSLPLPNSPYGTITIQIGGGLRELGLGERFHFDKGQVISLDVNMIQNEQQYKNTRSTLELQIWQCIEN